MSTPKFEKPKGEVRAERPEGEKVNKRSFSKDKKAAPRQSKDRPDAYKNYKFNPSDWYEKYPELFEVASTLGFNHIKGLPYVNAHGDFPLASSGTADNYNLSDSAVLTLQYITTPGACTNETSGFMMQMRQLYLALRRKYRGLNAYQVGDLAVTLFCVMEFYRYIAKLERIYGVCKYYSTKNRIMPATLPTALQFNYANVTANLADFRYGINALITRAASLCLPADIAALSRWFLLESNVFKDSEDERATYIVFDDHCRFYSYQATTYVQGGSAELSTMNPANSNNITFTDLLNAGSDLLELLIGDDDVTLIMSDLVAAFADGDGRLMFLEPLPEDYVVVPVYNADILEQVHNANIVGENTATAAGAANTYTAANFSRGSNSSWYTVAVASSAHTAITQSATGVPMFDLTLGNKVDSDQGLYWDQTSPTARSDVKAKVGNQLLDTWKDKPIPSDIMEMTRLKPAVKHTYKVVSSAYYHRLEVVGMGSEIIKAGQIFYVDKAGATQSYGGIGSVMSGVTSLYAILEKVDWHPLLFDYSTFETVTTVGVGWIYADTFYGDLDNARVITNDVLIKIHDAAIMSEFAVSSVKAIK